MCKTNTEIYKLVYCLKWKRMSTDWQPNYWETSNFSVDLVWSLRAHEIGLGHQNHSREFARSEIYSKKSSAHSDTFCSCPSLMISPICVLCWRASDKGSLTHTQHNSGPKYNQMTGLIGKLSDSPTTQAISPIVWPVGCCWLQGAARLGARGLMVGP